MTGRLDTVGIDLVAMCADDVVCTGAEPLFFLDYLAVGKVTPERVAAIVEGRGRGMPARRVRAAWAARRRSTPASCPTTSSTWRGSASAWSDEDRLLGPDRVREGDVLVGLASSGLHANGFSLVRSALLDRYPLRSRRRRVWTASWRTSCWSRA